MSTRILLPFGLLLLSGCAMPSARDAAAEARGFERGYQQAVRDQYWLIQRQQRVANPPPATKPKIP